MEQATSNKKKNVIIICIIVAVIVVAAIVGFNVYTNAQRQKEIEAAQAYIADTKAKFDGSTDRNEKLALINDLEQRQEQDTLAKTIENLNQEYASTIDSFKAFFIADYDQVIADHTLDVAVAAKADLETSKGKLAEYVVIIGNEGAVVLNEEDVKAYTDKINALISSYDTKIVEIVAAEEAAAKAEAERIAAEEAAAAQAEAERIAAEEAEKSKNSKKSDGNKSSGSGNSSDGESSSSSGGSGSSSGGSSSSNGGHGKIVRYSWAEDENGNEIPGTRTTFYEDGWAEDESGASGWIGDWIN